MQLQSLSCWFVSQYFELSFLAVQLVIQYSDDNIQRTILTIFRTQYSRKQYSEDNIIKTIFQVSLGIYLVCPCRDTPPLYYPESTCSGSLSQKVFWPVFLLFSFLFLLSFFLASSAHQAVDQILSNFIPGFHPGCATFIWIGWR